jgi:hypothetical protein
MTMSTSSAGALTRSAKKLKDLAVDTVKIPSPSELLARKTDEIATLKQKLAALVAKQIAVEKNPQHQSRDIAAIVVEKRLVAATISRLENEAGILKGQVVASRPQAPLAPRAQLWVDALPVPPPSPYTKAEMRAARAELDAVVAQKRAAAWNPREVEALAPAYKEAKLKVDVLSGGHRGEWPARIAAYATREDMAAALKKWGKK